MPFRATSRASFSHRSACQLAAQRLAAQQFAAQQLIAQQLAPPQLEAQQLSSRSTSWPPARHLAGCSIGHCSRLTPHGSRLLAHALGLPPHLLALRPCSRGAVSLACSSALALAHSPFGSRHSLLSLISLTRSFSRFIPPRAHTALCLSRTPRIALLCSNPRVDGTRRSVRRHLMQPMNASGTRRSVRRHLVRSLTHGTHTSHTGIRCHLHTRLTACLDGLLRSALTSANLSPPRRPRLTLRGSHTATMEPGGWLALPRFPPTRPFSLLRLGFSLCSSRCFRTLQPATLSHLSLPPSSGFRASASCSRPRLSRGGRPVAKPGSGAPSQPRRG